MADFRKYDRRKKKRKKLKDNFNNIYGRAVRSIEKELTKFFQQTLTSKPL